jgi:aryl-alcohol dehydrogenase-like predicted oxidoreductase
MQHRRLGHSGLKISEIAYGNWITHGSQLDQDQALACTRAALDAGISTFDTADAYADTRAEEVLGLALADVRRESVEVLTKVYWPTGPGANERGLSRKHVMEAAHGSLRRLGTDYVDLYQAHRFDPETPLEETLRAFDDLVRHGKVLLSPRRPVPDGSRATDATGSEFIARASGVKLDPELLATIDAILSDSVQR